jgi:hypothetical protein
MRSGGGEDGDVEIDLDDEPLNPGESALVYGAFFRPSFT